MHTEEDPQVRRRMVNESVCSLDVPPELSASLMVYSPSSSAPGEDSPTRATTTSPRKGPALSSVPGEEEEQSMDPMARRWTEDPPCRTLLTTDVGGTVALWSEGRSTLGEEDDEGCR